MTSFKNPELIIFSELINKVVEASLSPSNALSGLNRKVLDAGICSFASAGEAVAGSRGHYPNDSQKVLKVFNPKTEKR